jgi:hypothetical protein
MFMLNPSEVGTGPGSAVAIAKSKAGPPLSLRSMPNTSQMTPNSKGAVYGRARQTILRSTVPPNGKGRGATWRNIDGTCRSCHSWLSVVNRRFSAMEIVIAVLIAGVTAAAIIATVRTTIRDGHRRVPTRHA